MSSSTKKSYTIPDVRIVPLCYVAVPISVVENIQIMRFISTFLVLFGGVLAGITYPSEFLYLVIGIAVIIIGLVLEYLKVHKVIRAWSEIEQRGTIVTGTTIIDPNDFEQSK